MWVILGLGSALFNSLSSVSAKKRVKDIDPIITAFIWNLFSLPVLLIPVLIFGLSSTDGVFWLVVLIRSFMDAIALILLARSFKIADISLTQPMLSLTPVFIIPISYFLNNDIPTAISFCGVILVTLGIYFNDFDRKRGFAHPLINIFKNKGIFLAFIVSIMYAVSSSLHTVGIRHSDPFTYAFFSGIFISSILFAISIYFKKNQIKSVFKSMPMPKLLEAGVFNGISLVFQMVGQSLTQASYLVAIKRTSSIMTAFLAKKYFSENIRNRILPICITVVGVILIVLGS